MYRGETLLQFLSMKKEKNKKVYLCHSNGIETFFCWLRHLIETGFFENTTQKVCLDRNVLNVERTKNDSLHLFGEKLKSFLKKWAMPGLFFIYFRLFKQLLRPQICSLFSKLHHQSRTFWTLEVYNTGHATGRL